MATNKTGPAAELRIGTVKPTVWENGVGGIRRHNVVFSRPYKGGEQWRTTQTFGRNDLLVLVKMADQGTHGWTGPSIACTVGLLRVRV